MPDIRQFQVIDLVPGESSIKLASDPFYGSVDIGAGARLGQRRESTDAFTTRLQREVTGGLHALDSTKQNHIEVTTGKRLQQKTMLERPELPPSEVPAPVLTSLEPSTAVIGQPSFDIHVMGEHFTPESVIVFNGFDEPTTFVSPTEVTTGINMDVWAAPSEPLPVLVRNIDGVESNALTFTFTAAPGALGAFSEDEADKAKPKGGPAGKHAPKK